MKTRAGPRLLRQTLTTFWQYNIYVQKPFNSGHSFVRLFKICLLLELFLKAYKPIHRYTQFRILSRQIRKNIYKLAEPSSYKLINIRIIKNKKNLELFCNFGSRIKIFPSISKTFSYKNIARILKKKIGYYRHSFRLTKYRPFSVFSEQILSIFTERNASALVNTTFSKFQNLKKFYFQFKAKALYNSIGDADISNRLDLSELFIFDQEEKIELFR